jgi:hypothetical protein
MVSRIGKMPMVVYETILGPLVDSGNSDFDDKEDLFDAIEQPE